MMRAGYIAPGTVILKFFVTIPAVCLPHVILSTAPVTLEYLVHKPMLPERDGKRKQQPALAGWSALKPMASIRIC